METSFVPFGQGSKKSIGENISLLEMAKLVLVFARDYDLELPDGWGEDEMIRQAGPFFDGGHCRVFKVTFMDGESWAIHVPLFVGPALQDTLTHLVEAEVLSTFDNAIKYPFIASTWILGSQLSWSDDFPTRPLRDEIVDQVVMIHTSLIECSKEARGFSLTHFKRIIQNKIPRVRDGLLPEITEQDCSDQMGILPTVLLPELDEAPFAIAHGHMSPLNILIAKHHNVTGIINWGVWSWAPFQQVAYFPQFLQLEPIYMLPSPALLKDRETYIASVRRQASPVVASMMIPVLSSVKVDFQHFFLESIISKGMHRQLAHNGWRLSLHGQGSEEEGDNGKENESIPSQSSQD
ncbi:hypothetical protein HK57_00013 [Aspergillus ustus]|uniref:Aminoglycoside phosphotransferase domain-containing protein n=1 Tax=Aspergillus ustus TaxID=40382 RepID=A0A0C1EFQ7_ASPUT|nr:hypothetical protein HK57_00013 [Aspergillus ustus]